MRQYRTFTPMRQLAGGDKNSGRIQHRSIKLGGMEFDSMAEHERYLELCVLRDAGEIHDLVCHPTYQVLPPQRTPEGRADFRGVRYTPDFRYVTKDGREVVEEVKSEYSRMEKDYVIRRKLLYYTQGIYTEELIR